MLLLAQLVDRVDDFSSILKRRCFMLFLHWLGAMSRSCASETQLRDGFFILMFSENLIFRHLGAFLQRPSGIARTNA